MNRTTLAPLLACCLMVPSARGQEGNAARERAIAAHQELGGSRSARRSCITRGR